MQVNFPISNKLKTRHFFFINKKGHIFFKEWTPWMVYCIWLKLNHIRYKKKRKSQQIDHGKVVLFWCKVSSKLDPNPKQINEQTGICNRCMNIHTYMHVCAHPKTSTKRHSQSVPCFLRNPERKDIQIALPVPTWSSEYRNTQQLFSMFKRGCSIERVGQTDSVWTLKI